MADPKLIATLSSLLGSLSGVKEKQFPNHTKLRPPAKTSSSSPAAPAMGSFSNSPKKESPTC